MEFVHTQSSRTHSHSLANKHGDMENTEVPNGVSVGRVQATI